MKTSIRSLVLLASALGSSFVGAGQVWAQSSSPRAPRLQIGDVAPPIAVSGWWKNRAPRLNTGPIYLIDFWAGWCEPCRQSFPHLAELQRRYAGQNVVTVAISIDSKKSTAEQFLYAQGGSFETYVGLDSKNRTWMNWADAAGQTEIPTAFLVGRDGKIAWIGHPLAADEPLSRLVQGQPPAQTPARAQAYSNPAPSAPAAAPSAPAAASAANNAVSIAEQATERIAQIRARWAQLRPVYRGMPYAQQPALAPDFQPGVLQADFVRDGLNTLNFARFVAGLPDDVAIDDALQSQAQCGALLLAHLKRLDHTPRQPDDFPTALYKVAYRSTSSSNLAAGPGTLHSAIRLYLDDSPSGQLKNGTDISLGHRRWILNPALQKTGLGLVNGFSTMQSFDHGRQQAVDRAFAAWPAAGAHPVEFFAPHTLWSLTLNPAHYRVPQGGRVRITLRRAQDGRTWTFPSGDEQGYFAFNTQGFGVNNCLMFRPNGVENYRDGDRFDVTVAGLTDANGASAELRYSVTFFSLDQAKPNTA